MRSNLRSSTLACKERRHTENIALLLLRCPLCPKKGGIAAKIRSVAQGCALEAAAAAAASSSKQRPQQRLQQRLLEAALLFAAALACSSARLQQSLLVQQRSLAAELACAAAVACSNPCFTNACLPQCLFAAAITTTTALHSQLHTYWQLQQQHTTCRSSSSP